MEELRVEVKTVEVDCICPKCNKGRMRPLGAPVGRHYMHRCSEWGCLHTEMVDNKTYPYTTVERVPMDTKKSKEKS